MKIASASLAPWALALLLGACAPVHPSDVAPEDVRRTWQESEKALRTVAANMPTLAVPAPGASFNLDSLLKFDTSARQGAGDKRHLSNAGPGGIAVSDGPLAEIIAVKGIEYKSEMAFTASPYPIAIIVVFGTAGYPKLGLMPGKNYWIVQHVGSGWIAWIQPASGGAPHPLHVSTSGFDVVEPAIGASFVWLDTDENLRGLCGGKPCVSGPGL